MTTPEEISHPHSRPLKHYDYAPGPQTQSEPTTPQVLTPGTDTDTETNSSDEFDWDNDDEFETREERASKAKRGRALWLAFMRLSRFIRVLLVGILVAAILITPFIVVKLRFKNNPVSAHVHAWSLWLTVTWAAGCVTYLVVDAIPRFILSIVILFGGQVERLKLEIEVAMAVIGWTKLTLDISWAWIALSVIRFINKPPGNYWIIVNRVMQALFATSVILLAEKLFLHFVAINFHEKALAERLAENRLALKALDRLSNAQPIVTKTPPYPKRGHNKSPSASVELFGAPQRGHRWGQNSADGSPVPSERVGTFSEKPRYRRNRNPRKRKAVTSIIVDQVGGAIGAVALKDSRFNKEGVSGGLYSARRLARKLFGALSDVTPRRSHLVVEDFYPYFRTTADAHEAFAVFDKDGNGDITKKEMREAVQRIYRERKSLVSSLKDADAIVAKLDAVLLAVALVGVIFVCLLIFNRKNTLASLVPLATIILGFSFVFGHSAQTLFESLIFIFSTHVFDVGDLVMIDDQALFVREFGLFSTTFRRVDGQEIVAPNALLASTKLVHNLRRSNSTWETTKLTISYDTPLETIEQIKIRISAFITANSREWSGSGVNIEKMEYQNAITLVVAMEHRSHWQDWDGRWNRRNSFMRNLKQILEDLDVEYKMPTQPVILPQTPSFYAQAESEEVLGNAGGFRASDLGRERSLREGVSSFSS